MIRKTLYPLFLCCALGSAMLPCTTGAQQHKTASVNKTFPGFTAQQMAIVRRAATQYSIPLPTWLPPGFKVEKIVALVEKKVPVDDRKLEITYAKQLPGGKKQTFVIRAGIEGIGSLVYETTDSVKSAMGTILVAYQPVDDYDKKLSDYACTEWFNCDTTAYALASGMAITGNTTRDVLIPRQDMLKILASLRKL